MDTPIKKHPRRAYDLVDVLLDTKPDTNISVEMFGGYTIHKDS